MPQDVPYTVPGLDPLVTCAFQTIRYLTQCGEMIAGVLGWYEGSALMPRLHHLTGQCCDRAEHIAQEFVPGGFGVWHEKTAFIQEQLLADVDWLADLLGVDDGPIAETITKWPGARPRLEDLAALATALRACRPPEPA